MQSIHVNGRALTPSKIVCIGRNYVAHIAELGNEIPDAMVVFNKPNSAISQQLRATAGGEALHYEGELAFVVSQGRLAAVGFGLDLTRRELQSGLKSKGLPWERAKAFDGAAVFSEFVTLPDTLTGLSLQLDIDGVTRQAGGVELMMYSPTTIIQELQQFMTLEDGDVIMTGTPEGVGVIEAGARFEARVFNGDEELLKANWIAD